MNQLLKMDLLILDDWGIQKITAAQRQDLMEVIEDRHDRRSTLIASRLLHGAHRLELRGESMRKLTASLTDRDRSE